MKAVAHWTALGAICAILAVLFFACWGTPAAIAVFITLGFLVVVELTEDVR